MTNTFKLKFDDKEIKALLNNLHHEIKSVAGVKVGWIHEPHDKSGDGGAENKTMEQIVFDNEFGSLTSPPRPFIRTVLKKRPSVWRHLTQELIGENLKLPRIAAIIGEQIKNDLKKSILSNIPPPNSPATIARKKSDRTLIDTGAMLNSIHTEIIKSIGKKIK